MIPAAFQMSARELMVMEKVDSFHSFILIHTGVVKLFGHITITITITMG